MHRQGEPLSAVSLYRQAISLCPEHVDAWFYLGLLYSSIENLSEAIACFESAQLLFPDEPAFAYQLGTSFYAAGQKQMAIDQFKKTLALDASHWQAAYNLGTAYLGQGKTAKAIAAYESAARLQPQDPDIHFNLALAYKKAGRLPEAVQSYLCALEIASDDAEVHYNLALLYKELDCKQDAITSLEIAIALRPDYAAAHGNLGVLYLDQDRVEEAISCYRQLIALDHKVDAARHVLAALTGETTACAPSSYIADLFDSFSSHFEERLLVDLEYRTPWNLKNLLLAESHRDVQYPDLLDLGCGTGLVGQVFQDITTFRLGVDLSPGMVEVAREKNLYDQLVVAEIVDFLAHGDTLFDVIVAADVLIYVGDLELIFPAIAKRLAGNGRILFSTEHMTGTGFRLRQSGRYAHSADYINTLVKKSGLKVLAAEKSLLRKEKGEWIAGELFLLGF